MPAGFRPFSTGMRPACAQDLFSRNCRGPYHPDSVNPAAPPGQAHGSGAGLPVRLTKPAGNFIIKAKCKTRAAAGPGAVFRKTAGRSGRFSSYCRKLHFAFPSPLVWRNIRNVSIGTESAVKSRSCSGRPARIPPGALFVYPRRASAAAEIRQERRAMGIGKEKP